MRHEIGVTREHDLRECNRLFYNAVWSGEYSLPVATEAAASIILLISDTQRETDNPLQRLDAKQLATIGLPAKQAEDLFDYLQSNGVIHLKKRGAVGAPFLGKASLTLRGWDRWADIHKGREAGNFGFFAMAFSSKEGAFKAELIASIRNSLAVRGQLSQRE